MNIEDIFSYLKEIARMLKGNKFISGPTRAPESNSLSVFKGFQAPLKGTLRSSGGFDPTGKGSVGRIHQGVDLRGPIGTPIYSIAPGIVKYVRPDIKGGNTVIIDHLNGYSSYYAHCSVINVLPGEHVGYNDIIAKVGASGNAKGFGHLHIQVWYNGSLIDPASVIPGIPPYTPFNHKTERLVLPGAKEEAAAWNLEKHLGKMYQRTALT